MALLKKDWIELELQKERKENNGWLVHPKKSKIVLIKGQKDQMKIPNSKCCHTMHPKKLRWEPKRLVKVNLHSSSKKEQEVEKILIMEGNRLCCPILLLCPISTFEYGPNGFPQTSLQHCQFLITRKSFCNQGRTKL